MSLGLLTLACSLPAPQASPPPPSPSAAPSLAIADELSPSTAEGQLLPISATADINGTRIDLEVAETDMQRAIGLMFRPQIPDDRGMLFPFDSAGPVRFWMRNVLVPLDMVFLRGERVEAIAAEVPPCEAMPCPTYGPDVNIDQVIELRGGRAAELGLQVGDRISIDFMAQPPE